MLRMSVLWLRWRSSRKLKGPAWKSWRNTSKENASRFYLLIAISGASYLYVDVFGFGFPRYLMWENLECSPPCSLRWAIKPWRTSMCEAVIPWAALQWWTLLCSALLQSQNWYYISLYQIYSNMFAFPTDSYFLLALENVIGVWPASAFNTLMFLPQEVVWVGWLVG